MRAFEDGGPEESAATVHLTDIAARIRQAKGLKKLCAHQSPFDALSRYIDAMERVHAARLQAIDAWKEYEASSGRRRS